MAKPWFTPKFHGFGLEVSSWEGLVAIGVYILAVVAAFRFVPPQVIDRRLGMVLALAVVALLTGAFLLIVARTMEGELRWRWGKD